MVHTKVLPEKADLTKVESGEIDTRAPFHSVRDAVNLFGDRVSFSGHKATIMKAKSVSAEKPLIKEIEFHPQKELNRLKKQVQNAENTKAEALVELERAKQTIEDLSMKLKVLTEKQTEQCHKEGDPESSRDEYSNVVSDLNSLKQEMAEIRMDYDMSLEEKAAAMKQAEEAEVSAKKNREEASKLSSEIAALKEAIEQVNEMSAQTEQGNEKDAELESYRVRLEESAKKLKMMRKDSDPQVRKNLETKLAEVMNEIEALRKELEDAKAAKESLLKAVEEKNALECLVESLKRELESLRKEHAKLKEKESETNSVVGNLQVKLRECKSELEVASEKMSVTLNQLALEAENVRRESEEMRVENEKRLTIALREAKEAKYSETKALDKVKAMTEQKNTSGAKITISSEEFEALSRKVEESELKVAVAMEEVEAVKASESEAVKKLEATRKEMNDMKASIEEALKAAENAEEAKKTVEDELRRWTEKEHKNTTKFVSQVIEPDETQALEEIQTQAPTHVHHRMAKSGPVDYKVHHEEDVGEKTMVAKKLDSHRSSMSRKALLPSLSGIFNKKKGRVDRGSPSHKK